MADYGLHKNSEGYADPTAYEAIRGMAKPGEVWKYKGREVLIVKIKAATATFYSLAITRKAACALVEDCTHNPVCCPMHLTIF